MDTNVEKVVSLLKQSKNTVVVTGAGMSTEAGIPDFRGKNGIYTKLGENRVMEIINIDFFRRHPDKFYEFFRENFDFPKAQPSKAHLQLAEMEKKGFIHGIVTQNIDNLHQLAGSKRVIAIHGRTDRYLCTDSKCQEVHNQLYVDNCGSVVPLCSKCGSVLKPDVVLFGEQIHNYFDAQETIHRAQVLLVIGTSLTVYPMAGFVSDFNSFSQDLIIINQGHTQMDHAATVKIDANHTGDLLDSINKRL